MGYNNDKLKYDLVGLIEGVPSITEAPTLADIRKPIDARHRGRDFGGDEKAFTVPDRAARLEAIENELLMAMQKEAKREYLTADSNGVLHKIQNPALMAYQSYRGITPIARRKPERVGYYSVAAKEREDRAKNKNPEDKAQDWDNISPEGPRQTNPKIDW